MEALFSNQSLITNSRDLPLSELSNCKLIGLYFTAHWCPPCRTLTPKLINFYKAINDTEKNMEVVFISYDRDQDAMLEYLDEMPWAAVPFANEDLRESLGSQFDVTGIPMFVIIKSDGSEVTRDGRTHFMEKTMGAFEYWLNLSEHPEAPGQETAADAEEEVSDISKEPVTGLECDEGHPLIWHGDVGKFYKETRGNAGISCYYCKQALKRSSWHCRECKVDLCKVCRDWVVDSPAESDRNLVCLNSHPLRNSSGLSKFYMGRFLASVYTCRCCNLAQGGSNLHCRRCFFDMCGNCASQVVSAVPKSEQVKCGNSHGLQWRPELSKVYKAKFGSAAFCCDLCSGTYQGSGSFNCIDCTYDVCVKCMNEAVCKV